MGSQHVDLHSPKCSRYVTYGIQVEVADDITQVLHYGLACRIAGRVGRTHVCRVFSDDVPDGHFVLDHLIIALRIGDDAKILMRPCVRCDLVALCDHALDNIGPLCGCVNGSFADINSGDKECGLESVFGKLVKNSVGVDVGTARVSVDLCAY